MGLHLRLQVEHPVGDRWIWRIATEAVPPVNNEDEAASFARSGEIKASNTIAAQKSAGLKMEVIGDSRYPIGDCIDPLM